MSAHAFDQHIHDRLTVSQRIKLAWSTNHDAELVRKRAVEECLGSFTDSRPKYGMTQIGACFIEASESLASRPDISVPPFDSTVAGQALVHLREDKPHPSCRLWLATALTDAGENTVENAVLILGFDEAVEVVGVWGGIRVGGD